MKNIYSLLVLVGLSAFQMGCNNHVIESADFTMDPDLKNATLALNFGASVNPDFGGSYPLKDFGTVFARQSDGERPFAVGFTLNTSIFHAEEFVNFHRTGDLPNEEPFPEIIGKELVQIKLNEPVSSKVDVFTYVDLPPEVFNGEWIGVAFSLNFIDMKNFPPGLALSKNFLRDQNGKYRVVAVVYGPKLNQAGAVAVPGGIALFGNIKELEKSQQLQMHDFRGSKPLWKMMQTPSLLY